AAIIVGVLTLLFAIGYWISSPATSVARAVVAVVPEAATDPARSRPGRLPRPDRKVRQRVAGAQCADVAVGPGCLRGARLRRGCGRVRHPDGRAGDCR